MEAVAAERGENYSEEIQIHLQSERKHVSCLEARLQSAELRAVALVSEGHAQCSQHSTVESESIVEKSPAHQGLAASGNINASANVPKLAKLAILMQQNRGRNSNHNMPTSWRDNQVDQIPSLPAPPLEHSLITPRTGATPRKPRVADISETFIPRTHRLSNTLSPGNNPLISSQGNACSPSPSPTNSRSCSQDSFSDWGCMVPPISKNSYPEVDIENVPTSARSNNSLYGLYGTGPEAESQVLRKVIRDLEAQLERQSAELQFLRQRCTHTCT